MPDSTRTIISTAYEGDDAPEQLSAAIVSLVELCQFAMPDHTKVREAIIGANFETAPQEQADAVGAYLSLDKGVVDFPVSAVRHELFARDRYGVMVFYLLSHGKSKNGNVVFLSTIFHGAIEADAVKAVAHVTKKQPITGSRLHNARGDRLRRVFWDVDGTAGIMGMVASGPHNVEALNIPRAFTAVGDMRKRRR
ncbi:MAG: hypothetical protein AB7G40_14490 [Hyphomonadaceae bacterium]